MANLSAEKALQERTKMLAEANVEISHLLKLEALAATGDGVQINPNIAFLGVENPAPFFRFQRNENRTKRIQKFLAEEIAMMEEWRRELLADLLERTNGGRSPRDRQLDVQYSEWRERQADG